MPSSDPSGLRTVRLQVMLDRDELELVEDWRYRHRMPSLAAAIRELIRRGLLLDGEDMEDTDGIAVERQRSTDFRAI
ncbi:MAG: hypothetical protein ACMVO3_12690 [Thalassobaculum sp.]